MEARCIQAGVGTCDAAMLRRRTESQLKSVMSVSFEELHPYN